MGRYRLRPAWRDDIRRGKGQDAANGLLNALIAYWPGNEANGNALDAHTSGLDLTDTNTVTSNPGLVYALARQHTVANGEYHTRAGDDAELSMGDVDMTVAAWVYLGSKVADRQILGKWGAVGGGRGYALGYSSATDRFRFYVRSMADNANQLIDADTFGSPSTGTWYLVVAYHDSVNNTINIQVNNGAVDSVAWASGILDDTSAFRIGYGSAFGGHMDGRIGPTAVWKSMGGDGGVLTAAQRTAFYNGGAGLSYTALTGT